MSSLNDLIRFKRQLLIYEAYLNGFGYLRYSRKKHKVRIAINKRTYWIINSKMKQFKLSLAIVGNNQIPTPSLRH